MRSDIPTGPRSFRQPDRTASPRLTGANNVPVPSRKGWRAEGGTDREGGDKNQAETPVKERDQPPQRGDRRVCDFPSLVQLMYLSPSVVNRVMHQCHQGHVIEIYTEMFNEKCH